jgi:hypothetical protein
MSLKELHVAKKFTALSYDLRWIITPHAVERYIERINPRASYEEALTALAESSCRARFFKKQTPSGNFDYWISDGDGIFFLGHRHHYKWNKLVVASVVKVST